MREREREQALGCACALDEMGNGRCVTARRKPSPEKVGMDRTDCPLEGFGVRDV